MFKFQKLSWLFRRSGHPGRISGRYQGKVFFLMKSHGKLKVSAYFFRFLPNFQFFPSWKRIDRFGYFKNLQKFVPRGMQNDSESGKHISLSYIQPSKMVVVLGFIIKRKHKKKKFSYSMRCLTNWWISHLQA